MLSRPIIEPGLTGSGLGPFQLYQELNFKCALISPTSRLLITSSLPNLYSFNLPRCDAFKFLHLLHEWDVPLQPVVRVKAKSITLTQINLLLFAHSQDTESKIQATEWPLFKTPMCEDMVEQEDGQFGKKRFQLKFNKYVAAARWWNNFLIENKPNQQPLSSKTGRQGGSRNKPSASVLLNYSIRLL